MVNAIVKAIQKVTQWITKALTKVFGRTIGGAIAGLINSVINILTFPVHVAYYSLNGDWKGLFKYMGQIALQVALIALNFIPGVGQALYAGLQFLFQAFFAVVKFLLAPLLQLAGALFSGIGSFIGSLKT